MYKHEINKITLGSLFDGIGGFPYAGSFFGIKPLWASEIMPQAISVTKRYFPEMEHVGDITKLDGAKLPPVDIITFGSPCQDLSTAGKRRGLAGERSGLFSEAIRIIDEMRRSTNGRYPRYAIWENVPGALSSGNPRGSDFQAVLEAFAKTEIPLPRFGGWANAGMVRGGSVDIAWCVYNAQHFGVPQRRRRVFLICDFGGRSAGEILFIPKSLSGYFAACRAKGQSFAADAKGCAGGAGCSACVKDIAATIFAGYGNHWNGNAGAYDGANFALSPAKNGIGFDGYNGDLTGEQSATLGVNCGMSTGRNGVLQPNCLNPWDTQQSRVFTEDGTSPTLAGADGGGGRNPGGLVFAAFLGGASAKARSIGYSEKVSPTLKGEPCGFSSPCVCESKSCIVLNDQGGDSLTVEKSELSPTLRSETHGNLPIVSKCEAYPINTQIATRHEALGENTGFGVGKDGDPAFTLQKAHSHAVAVGVHQGQSGDVNVSKTAYTLTTSSGASARNAPLVCENLRAFSLDSDGSNSMKSANPNSGCRETETARTIDTFNPCPSKNQGGIAVLDIHPKVTGTLCASGSGLSRPGGMASETDLCVAYCLQGNMIGRKDENGPRGDGVNENLSFTLTSTDVNGVATVFSRQRSDTFKEDNITGTQTARQCKDSTDLVCEQCCFASSSYGGMKEGVTTLRAEGGDNGGGSENLIVSKKTMHYIVRRLLPIECERLQGYPDGWTEFGHDDTPISDTRRYQMLGNSVATPCVAYIMMGIAEQMRGGDFNGICSSAEGFNEGQG